MNDRTLLLIVCIFSWKCQALATDEPKIIPEEHCEAGEWSSSSLSVNFCSAVLQTFKTILRLSFVNFGLQEKISKYFLKLSSSRLWTLNQKTQTFTSSRAKNLKRHTTSAANGISHVRNYDVELRFKKNAIQEDSEETLSGIFEASRKCCLPIL